MKRYSFCKKNGQIKQFYIPICEYIVSAKINDHVVTLVVMMMLLINITVIQLQDLNCLQVTGEIM